MMTFPLSLWDISLWLAVVALILLSASEVLMPYYGGLRAQIDRKRLRNIALATSVLFLTTALMRVISALLSR